MYSHSISIPYKNYTKELTVYYESTVPLRAYIFYFHGGGLLYGSRLDLPQFHLEQLTKAGFCVIAFDYPLAPDVKIDAILDDVIHSINHTYPLLQEHFQLQIPYFLWGRSAGAYLCLLAGASGKLSVNPKGILSYYGYGFLCNDWYDKPNPYYQGFPKISVDFKASKEIQTNKDIKLYYNHYVAARQQGIWKNCFFEGRDKDLLLNFSLRTVDQFPCPLFCAHSIRDVDVPYSEFIELCNRFHAKRFISPLSVHDFDQDEQSTFTKSLLDETITFINHQLG